MNTYEYAGDDFTEPRSHPWVDTVDDSECRYYDLTASPEHIQNSLEDFKPFCHHPAVKNFYSLLSELNQPHSGLESNDCAFIGPHKNDNAAFAKKFQCSGRVMILFRNLIQNTIDGNIEWLTLELHKYLAVLDVNFRWGIIGTTIVPVRYLALGNHESRQLGFQLMISFWAFGNSEKETMQNVDRVIKNLSQGIGHLCALVAQG